MQVQGISQSTQTVSGTLSPQWHEQMQFAVSLARICVQLEVLINGMPKGWG